MMYLSPLLFSDFISSFVRRVKPQIEPRSHTQSCQMWSFYLKSFFLLPSFFPNFFLLCLICCLMSCDDVACRCCCTISFSLRRCLLILSQSLTFRTSSSTINRATCACNTALSPLVLLDTKYLQYFFIARLIKRWKKSQNKTHDTMYNEMKQRMK